MRELGAIRNSTVLDEYSIERKVVQCSMLLHMIGLPIGEQKEMQNLGPRKSIKYNCPIM